MYIYIYIYIYICLCNPRCWLINPPPPPLLSDFDLFWGCGSDTLRPARQPSLWVIGNQWFWWQSQGFHTLDAQNAALVHICQMHVTTVTGMWHLGCSDCSSHTLLCHACDRHHHRNHHHHHHYHGFMGCLYLFGYNSKDSLCSDAIVNIPSVRLQ